MNRTHITFCLSICWNAVSQRVRDLDMLFCIEVPRLLGGLNKQVDQLGGQTNFLAEVAS